MGQASATGRALSTCLALWVCVADAAAAQEYVLVERDAHLYARPDASSERVRDPWAREHVRRLGPFWVMRFAGERNGWVAIATVPAFRASEHCYETPRALAGLDVRLFVRSEDVAQVVARTVSRSYPGGGSVTLVSGAGLVARGRNRYDVALPGATLRIELPEGSAATRYRPEGQVEIGRSANALLAPGAHFELGGGGRISTEPPSRTRSARRSRVVDFTTEDAEAPEPPRAILALEVDPERRPRTRATLRTGCLEANGFVRSRDLTTDRPARPVRDPSPRGATVRPGAALYWPDGTQAGRAADRVTLTGSVTPNGSRLCFDHAIRHGARGPDDTLTLCADRAAVSRASR